MANVLIVDDSRTARKILKSALEQGGHTVIAEATNGKEAIEKFEDVKPDVITLDVTMPVLDGVGVLKEIRSRSSEVKIIMVTASGQKNKILECIKIGANEFITKPYDPKEVTDAIRNVLTSAQD